MANSLCSGARAEAYLARHAGFENRIELGDLFRALKLPEGTALQQRINDRIRSQRRRGQQPSIRTWYEQKNGAVKIAHYWIPKKAAKAIIAAAERKAMLRASRRKAA